MCFFRFLSLFPSAPVCYYCSRLEWLRESRGIEVYWRSRAEEEEEEEEERREKTRTYGHYDSSDCNRNNITTMCILIRWEELFFCNLFELIFFLSCFFSSEFVVHLKILSFETLLLGHASSNSVPSANVSVAIGNRSSSILFQLETIDLIKRQKFISCHTNLSEVYGRCTTTKRK